MTSGTSDAVFTLSTCIKQLNAIDRDTVNLLHSAGFAIKALTNSVSTSNGKSQSDQAVPLEQRKQSFTAATSRYFTLLSSLDVRLRRQIFALEEADILPAESSDKEVQTNFFVTPAIAAIGGPPNAPPPKATNREVITGGGLGGLDVGWLNSRNDRVGKGKEAEVWEEARRCVEAIEHWRTESFGISDMLNQSSPVAPDSSELMGRT